jgi:hypothetical protein
VNGTDWFYIWLPGTNGNDTSLTTVWTFNIGPALIYKSSDQGATWTMVYDIMASLPLPPNCFLWDQSGNVGSCPGPPGHILFTAYAIAIPSNALFLCDYDMTAGTATVISTPFDNGGNPSSPWGTVFFERDPATGKVYVVFFDWSGPANHLTLAIWDGAAWTGPINLTPEADWPTGNSLVQWQGAGLAADGTLYVCYSLIDYAPAGLSAGSFLRWYDGALSAPLALGDPPGNGNAPFPFGGRIEVSNGKVIVPLTPPIVPPLGFSIGFWETIPTVYVGNHPNPASLAQVDLGGQLTQTIQAGVINGKVRVFWIETYTRDGLTPLDSCWYSDFNGSSWTPPILFHDEQANPSFPAMGALQRMHNMSPPADISPALMGIMIGLEYPVPLNQNVTYYATEFQFTLAPAPPPAPSRPKGGHGSSIFICPPLNQYDQCLNQDMLRAKQLEPAGPRCRIPSPWRRSYPHVDMPEQAEALYQSGAIAPPVVAAGYVPVFTFKVGQGYEGVLNALYQTFTGVLAQGSGDLEWSIEIGRWFAKQLSNVGLALGSAQRLYPIFGGYLLRPNQQVTYYVRNNNAATIPPGVGLILCGLKGSTYPLE